MSGISSQLGVKGSQLINQNALKMTLPMKGLLPTVAAVRQRGLWDDGVRAGQEFLGRGALSKAAEIPHTSNLFIPSTNLCEAISSMY